MAPAVAVWSGLWVGASLGLPGVACAVALAVPLAWLSWRAPDRVGTVALLLALGAAAAARGGAHRAALDRTRQALGAPDVLFRIAGPVVTPPELESGEPVAIVAVCAAEPPLFAGTRVRLRLPAGTAVEWSDRLEG